MKTIPELDGIRAIAILAVLAIHAQPELFRGGYLGVDLFFVLSGFLITSLLVREFDVTGKIDLKKFYIRRALRILPPLGGGIILAAALWSVQKDAMPPVADFVQAFPAALFFYANLVPNLNLGILSHTWSLSVEEHFYLAWPIILYLALKGKHNVFMMLGLCIMIALILRATLFLYDVNPVFLQKFTLTRMDSLAAGCLAAIWHYYRAPREEHNWLLAVLFCAVFAVFFLAPHGSDPWINSIGFTCLAILFALFIFNLISAESAHCVRRFLTLGFMRYIGKRSYGVYIYHAPLFIALEPYRTSGIASHLTIGALQVASTFLVAAFSYRTIEMGAMSLKGRFKAY